MMTGCHQRDLLMAASNQQESVNILSVVWEKKPKCNCFTHRADGRTDSHMMKLNLGVRYPNEHRSNENADQSLIVKARAIINSHTTGVKKDLQTACLVVNPITVGNFAFLFNCTPVGRT